MKNEIEFKFGDYAIIEQKRHGAPNEMFVHKVVGQLRSNTWVDVPVRVPATETLHGEMEEICLCICCGIDETEVRRYRVKDMQRHSPVSLVADEKRGSTITQQAANDLIQSLESAGELSIKERKYLELAKAYQQLAAERDASLNAERVWEKTMMEVCGEDGPASVANEIRALQGRRDTALTALRAQVEQLAAENVALKLKGRELLNEASKVYQKYNATIDFYSGDFMDGQTLHEFQFVLDADAPATDRIVAGIKADEEKAVLNDLLRHLDKIDIENLSSPWELSSEVVAFVNSRLLREEAK